MSGTKETLAIDNLCGCGRSVRYCHFTDGVERMSCNKYEVCKTYEELSDESSELRGEMLRYKNALQAIVTVNAMDYEYKAWAKEALTIEGGRP